MAVKNYQKGGPSGRGRSSKSYTFKVSDKDAKGEKKTRGFTVRCGHGDKRGICAVAESLVKTANARLKGVDTMSDEDAEKHAYDTAPHTLPRRKLRKQSKRDYSKK